MVAELSNQVVEDLIPALDGDTDQVRDAVVAVIRWLSSLEDVERIIALRIDNWFDTKWLGFTCKIMGAFGTWNGKDFGRLVVPPFVANRVLAQREIALRDGVWLPAETVPMAKMQRSETNQFRYYDAEYPSTAALWISSDCESCARCSLMTYYPTQEGVTGWYAELAAKHEWEPWHAVGITPDMLRTLIARHAAE